ncbi:MFS transporter [Streptomyces capparidis]
MTRARPPGGAEDPHRGGGLPHAIGLGTVPQSVNSSMMAVAVLAVRDEFHAGTAASWLITGAYLTTAVGAPTMGRLADLLGHRRVFLSGLALASASSVAAALAPGLGWLIACRVAQCFGTSAQFPAGVAIIRRQAGRSGARPAGALGVVAGYSQATVALGPALGGLLTAHLSWRATFLVTVPLAAVAAAAVHRWCPPDEPARRTGRGGARSVLAGLDLPGLGLFTAGVTCLICGLLALPEGRAWPLLAAATAALAAFCRWERRTRTPFVDVNMLAARPALTLAYARTAVTYAVFYAVFYGLPRWLHDSARLDTTAIGAVMFPIAAAGAASVALATAAEKRWGYGGIQLIGSVTLLAGGAALAVTTDSATALPLLFALTALLGLPSGFNNLGNQVAMYAAAPARDMGTTSGLYRTSQYVGATAAAVIVELVCGSTADDAGLHRLGFTVMAGGAALAAGAVPWRALRRGAPRAAHGAHGGGAGTGAKGPVTTTEHPHEREEGGR